MTKSTFKLFLVVIAGLYAIVATVWLIVPTKQKIVEHVVRKEIETKIDKATEKIPEQVKKVIDIRKPLTIVEPKPKVVKNWAFYIKDVDVQQVIKSSVDMVVIDLDTKDGPITKQQVQKIKDSDKVVIAYLSVGDAEEYRRYWDDSWTKPKLAPKWLGKQSTVWKGVYHVTNPLEDQWMDIVKKMIDTAINNGFDGIVVAGIKPQTEQAELFLTKISEYTKRNNKQFKLFVQDYTSKEIVGVVDGIVVQGVSYNLFGAANKNIKQQTEVLNWFVSNNKTIYVVEFVEGTKWQSAKQVIEQNKWIGYSAPIELDVIRGNQ